jgi:hypothetical protein
VFTHGQLYVALSRVTNAANLRMIVPDTEEARVRKNRSDICRYLDQIRWIPNLSRFHEGRANLDRSDLDS